MHKEFLESSRYPAITFRPTRVAANFDPSKQQSFVVDGVFQPPWAGPPFATEHYNAPPPQMALFLTTRFDVPYVQWGIKDPSRIVLSVNKDVSIDIESVAGINVSRHN